MKILFLINNTSTPLSLLAGEKSDGAIKLKGLMPEASIDFKSLEQASTDIKDFDTFISEELNNYNLNEYDLIILPTNIDDTYLEFKGLRVAAHIRLTPEWQSQTTPILFLGGESRDEIMRFTPFGAILHTFGIYYSQNYNPECLSLLCKTIKENYPSINTTSHQYANFLDRMRVIKAPANYSTHHSIANEWAIMRWSEIFNWGETSPQIKFNKSDFRHILYFKYLKALNKIANNDSANQVKPFIDGIKGKRIIYIDDEAQKGWGELFEQIFEKSNASLETYPFGDEQKSLTRQELIAEVETYLKQDYDGKTGGADCYIIDLRLHDSDFGNGASLTGIDIAKFLKKKLNPGLQVIAFTASNKVWNYNVLSEIGIDGYIIKGSPIDGEFNRLSPTTTFDEFKKTLSQCIHNNRKKEIYTEYKKIEAFIDLFKESKTKIISDKADEIKAWIKSALFQLLKTNNPILNKQADNGGGVVRQEEDAHVEAVEAFQDIGFSLLSLFQVIELICNEYITAGKEISDNEKDKNEHIKEWMVNDSPLYEYDYSKDKHKLEPKLVPVKKGNKNQFKPLKIQAKYLKTMQKVTGVYAVVCKGDSCKFIRDIQKFKDIRDKIAHEHIDDDIKKACCHESFEELLKLIKQFLEGLR